MNLVIIFLIAIFIGYSLFLKKDKLIIVILSSYLSFVLVYFLNPKIIDLLYVFKNHPDIVKIFLFLFFLIIFCLWAEFMAACPNKKGIIGYFFNIFYGFLTICLILTLLISLVTLSLQEKLFQKADFLAHLYKFKNIWIALPLILMVVNGFLKARKKK